MQLARLPARGPSGSPLLVLLLFYILFMARIALIGASSFLGKAILETFGDTTHQIHCWSRQAMLTNTQMTWHAYNYPTQPLDYDALCTHDVIYYCAGAGIQPKHKDSEAVIYELNSFEPIRLIAALQTRNYQGKLVTFGSYFEIGDAKERKAYTEIDLVTHQNALPNAYCRAKNLLTRFIHTNATHLPFCLQHFILTNIYGSTENPNRLIPYIIRDSLADKPLQFTAGIQERQYTHVTDISRFLLSSLEHSSTGIFNLTHPARYRVREVIELTLDLVTEQTGKRPKASFGTVDKRDTGMLCLALDGGLMADVFGFEFEVDLRDGVLGYF